MNQIQEYRLEPLTEPEMIGIRGGATGSGELGHDIGYLMGLAAGLFLRIGESLYRSGGITGTNPYMR